MQPPSLPDQFVAAFLVEVRRLRIERHWTQSDLADRTHGDIHASTLAGYETGHRRMRLDAAWVIAAALGMDLSALLRSIEHTTRSGDTRLDVHRLQQSSDPVLQPARRWVRTTHPDLDGPDSTIHLSEEAVAALAALMGITTVDCRRRLEPYVQAPIGSTRAQHVRTLVPPPGAGVVTGTG